MTALRLANARLVLPSQVVTGTLVVEDGRIAEIVPGTAVPAGSIDCDGDLIAPGLIELHTDNLERHLQPRPGVDWPHDAAVLAHDAELAGAGITTVFDAVRVGSIPSDSKAGYAKYARALVTEILTMRDTGLLRASHLLHLRCEVCSETLADELAEFGPADGIGIVSLMDHTPGQRQFRDVSKLEAYVRGKRGLSAEGFEQHLARLAGLRERFGEMHERATVDFATRVGAVLASHDDTTADHVATSAGYGIRLAEFPTTLEAAEACHAHGIAVMMGAPNLIRGGSHSGNVAAADLAAADRLDILSSDYVPAGLLTAALRLGELWDDLPRGLATVTAAPADAASLSDRGRLAPGLRADVIRIRRAGAAARLMGTWVAGARVA